MDFLIHATTNAPPNGMFFHLVNPLWDVLLAVHEDPGPDFLHDYVKFDPYLTIGTTFIT